MGMKMHKNCQDLTGRRFERLTVRMRVADRVSDSGNHSPQWECSCECGTIKTVGAGNLRRGSTQSCGCLHREQQTRHGFTKHPLFKTWKGMKERCYLKSSRSYSNYGARGITVCARWLASFTAFCADMGARPCLGYTVHRKDNDAGYSPENCVWANTEVQCNCKTDTIRVTHSNLNMSIAQWTRAFALSSSAIGNFRRKRDCTWQDAINYYVEKL